jgi:hypothetical protein
MQGGKVEIKQADKDRCDDVPSSEEEEEAEAEAMELNHTWHAARELFISQRAEREGRLRAYCTVRRCNAIQNLYYNWMCGRRKV